jgi:hypothetical protein
MRWVRKVIGGADGNIVENFGGEDELPFLPF